MITISEEEYLDVLIGENAHQQIAHRKIADLELQLKDSRELADERLKLYNATLKEYHKRGDEITYLEQEIQGLYKEAQFKADLIQDLRNKNTAQMTTINDLQAQLNKLTKNNIETSNKD